MSIVIMRSTGPQNWPEHFTPEFCVALKAEDPLAYATSVLAEFGHTEYSFCDPTDVEATARERRPAQRQGPYVLSCDQSRLAGRDGWAVVVCAWQYPRGGRSRVMLTHPSLPGVYLGPAHGPMGEPLYEVHDPTPWLRVSHSEIMDPSWTFDEICARLRSLVSTYRPALALSDEGADVGGLTSLFNSLGVQYHHFGWHSAERSAGFQLLGRLIKDRQIQIEAAEIRAQLLRVKAVLQPSGSVTHDMPRTKAGGHCDLVAALVTHCLGENERLIANSPIAPVGGARHVVAGR